MFPEQISPPDVAAQRVHRLVSADVHHLPDRGARLGRAGQEATAEAVPGIENRIQPTYLA